MHFVSTFQELLHEPGAMPERETNWDYDPVNDPRPGDPAYIVSISWLGTAYLHSYASGKLAITAKKANIDIRSEITATGIHFRWDFFTLAMTAHTRCMKADAAVNRRRLGQSLHHNDHMSIPDSDPATNCATVAPPLIRNT